MLVGKSLPIPVVTRSKAWVCGRWLAGIAGSNSAGGMNVFLVWLLCVGREGPLRRADLSSRGVLPSVYVSLSVNKCNSIPLHLQWVGRQKSKPRMKERKKENSLGKRARRRSRRWMGFVKIGHRGEYVMGKDSVNWHIIVYFCITCVEPSGPCSYSFLLLIRWLVSQCIILDLREHSWL